MWKSVRTIQELSVHLKGYLCLTVMSHQRGDPFPVYLDRGSRALVSVVKGCSVSPYAEALFRQNAKLIDGLLMDATWKIIRNCVASILMLSIMNVGVPVALAIGPKEDKSLSETFYSTLLNLFGVDLGSYCVVSDEGAALRAVCASHSNRHFLCLRHFLVSLKHKLWSQEVGNLIRCRVATDLHELCAQYEPRFAAAVQDPSSTSGKRLCKVLERVGLVMTQGRLMVSNQAKWTSISMMERVPTRLPSTSNALESFHGHGNEHTPRRNDFIPSVVRVAPMINGKTLAFRAALEDTFALMIRKARRRARDTDPNVLASELQHYGTTPDDCGCGETCHSSALYRIACPCSHQYAVGAEKPRVPDVNLELRVPATAVTVVLERLEREERIVPSSEDCARWQARAVREIKNFSHSKKTAEIREYVREHFQVGSGFALGLPVSVFGLISDGISRFSA
jgi:hypothetical protein